MGQQYPWLIPEPLRCERLFRRSNRKYAQGSKANNIGIGYRRSMRRCDYCGMLQSIGGSSTDKQTANTPKRYGAASATRGHHCTIAPPNTVWVQPPAGMELSAQADYPCASYLAIENVRAKLVEWGHQEKPQFDKDGFQIPRGN